MNRSQRRAQADAALAEVYAAIPDIKCKGLCHHTCRPIGMSERERERIRVEGGVDLPGYSPDTDLRYVDPVPCPALTALNRCSVHELRPTICRLWGVTLDMRCPHGCVPDRYLDLVERLELVARSMEAGGQYGGGAYDGMPSSRMRAFIAERPEVQRAMVEGAAAGQRGDERLARGEELPVFRPLSEVFRPSWLR